MHKIDLIAFDLDGTLLTSAKKILQASKNAIFELKEKGKIITIITGRPLYSTLPFVRELKLDTYFSVSESSIVLNNKGDLLRDHSIEPDIMSAVLESSSKHSCHVVWATNRTMTDDFFISVNDYKSTAMKEFIEVESRVYALDKKLLKIQSQFSNDDLRAYMVFVLGFKDNITRLGKELEQYENHASILSNISLNPEYHDKLVGDYDLLILRPFSRGKMDGMNTILNHYGIPPENAMFFGDWYNDIDALDGVGYPVLMSNAPEEIKSRDGYFITGSNENDGIIQALKHFNLLS
ncbi:HAD family hydrolase [bacterium]|nr:HAD family hydrolase [bacterium]MBU1024766.1 HAD family hydrolase [bacterium]